MAKILEFLNRFTKNITYTVNNGLAKGLKRRGGLGFVPRFGPLTPEETFLAARDLPGKVIYDIGGHEGLFTIFFCRCTGKSGFVYSFEPNPVNYEKIVCNVRLNSFDNVNVFNKAVGEINSRSTLVYDAKYAATGSLDSSIVKQMKSHVQTNSVDVDVVKLDDFIEAENLSRADFIKIDVEGFEYNTLKGMSMMLEDVGPDLFIEMHGVDEESKQENSRRVLTFLGDRGYRIFHVETGKEVLQDFHLASRGHVFCRHRNHPELLES